MEFRTTNNRFLIFSLLVAIIFLTYSLYFKVNSAERIAYFIMTGVFVLIGITNSLQSIVLKEDEIEIARKYIGIHKTKVSYLYKYLNLTIEDYATKYGKKQRFILKHNQTNKKILEIDKNSFRDPEQVHQQLAKKFGVEYKPIIRKGFFSNKPK